MNGLQGKRALVTGGSRGIGARHGAAASPSTARTSRSDIASRRADADALVASIRERHGVNAVAHASDISTVSRRERVGAIARTALGGLDFFVGNAGIWPVRRRRARRHDGRALAAHDGRERGFGVLHDARGDSAHFGQRTHRARVEHRGSRRRRSR